VKPIAAMLIVAALMMWGIKRFYADAAVDRLRWMLAPTSAVVTAATGVRFEHQPGEGYVSRARMFVIAKACAGINFLIAAFGMIAWTLRRRARSIRGAGVVLVVSLLASYAAAVVVNASRIAAALWLSGYELRGVSGSQLHRLEGITCYFVGLVLLFELLRLIDTRRRSSFITR